MGVDPAEVLVVAASGKRIGPYRVYYTLGEGGMGVVHRATHVGSGEAVALKTAKAGSSALHDALRREIATLKRLEHPCIVRVVDAGEHEGNPYYAMAVAPGTSLREQLNQRDTPFPVDEVMFVGLRLAHALAFAHGHGVVHRDIKPGNVMLSATAEPVLIDFGLSIAHERDGRERLDVNGTGGMSLPYAAPERLLGLWPDGRSDLYSLGCILYEMLTLKHPFVGRGRASAQQLKRAALDRDAPPSIESHGVEVPKPLASLVYELLLPKPEDRPSHADVVVERLLRLGAPPMPSSPVPPAVLYRPRFVGRQEVWKELETLLDAASAGRGSVVGLRGPSGVGKTRLMLEASKRHGGYSMMATVPDRGALPFACLRAPLAAIAGLCTSAEDTTACFGDLARLMAMYAPSVCNAPGFEDTRNAPVVAGAAARMRLFHAMARALRWVGKLQPVLVMADDVQWADQLSIDFVHWCVTTDALADSRVLLVAAWRGEEQSKALDTWLAAGLSIIELQPLDVDDVARMVTDVLSTKEPTPHLAAALAEQCGGNPFMVSAYLRITLEKRVL
jgi:eukaryotic-like serine/threonine-protein kinase